MGSLDKEPVDNLFFSVFSKSHSLIIYSHLFQQAVVEEEGASTVDDVGWRTFMALGE